MGRISKKTALKRCMELWDWLAKNPLCTKQEWPGWNGYGEAALWCWACEYGRKYALACASCILINLWPRECMHPSSPYVKWNDATDPLDRKKYALEIANYCRNLLKA